MANTFSFDDAEFKDQSGESDAADEALASIEESPAREEQDPELSDVDLRLETADYYRAILKHEFFDTESSAAQVVDREIRSFIRERLEVLLGIRGPREPVQAMQVTLPFEDEEIEALKLLAAKVLKKPGLITEPAPAVKKMATPEPSQSEKKLAPKLKPAVKKVPAPAPAPSTKPRAKPGPKPKSQAAVRQPEEAPVAKSIGAPSQDSTPKVVDRLHDGGESQTFIDSKGNKVTLTEGEIIEQNGQRFLVARNAEGTLYRKNITGQVAPPNRLPPMTPQQMSIISQQQAESQLQSLDETTGMAIVASLTRS